MIRIGPAGWAYKDWRGIVYPEKGPRGFSELEYIAGSAISKTLSPFRDGETM
jgi:hypothetical protein